MSYFDYRDDETRRLQGPLGEILGEIGRGSSGKLEARDNLGHLLGTYDDSCNRTTDANGYTMGYGNWLPCLFDRKRK